MRSQRVLGIPIVVALAFIGVPGLGASLEGCTSAPDADTGSAEFIATTAQALSTADVQRVTVTISGPGITTPITSDLVRVGGQWKGTLGAIPVGVERTFHADAFDTANVMLYTGEVEHVTITRGVTALVSLLLQQRAPAIPFRNSAPRIDTLTASSDAVVPGEGLSLVATAHDPDAADTLTYAWTATGGTFGAPNALVSSWTAPAAEGTYQLTLRVTDTHSAVAALTVSIDVHTANGRGQAAVTTSLNTWPEVALVNATPTRIDIGESTALAIDAIDADHDALHYGWTATCAGTFDDAASATPHFTLLAPLPAGNACALVATVTDGRGGSNTGQISITTGAAVPAGLAPIIDTTFQSTASPAAGDVVIFRAAAHDPEGHGTTFAWSASAGTIASTGNTTSGSDEIVWTAPVCSATPPIVSVTVTDGDGQTTTHAFIGSPALACAPVVTATVPVGSNPGSIAVNPSTNKIYVTNYGNGSAAGTVSIIDGATNAVSTVPAGRGPMWVAINRVTNQIYVTNYGTSPSPDNSVMQIDGATNAVTTIPVGPNPYTVDVNETTNKIYVTQYGFGGNTVSIIDGATRAVTTLSVAGQPESIKVNATTNKIYMGHVNGSITVLDGVTNGRTNISLGSRIGGIAVNAVTNRIYFGLADGSVTVMDGATNARTHLSVNGGDPQVNTTTNKVYLTSGSGNNGSVIDGATNQVTAFPLGGPANNMALLPSLDRVYVTHVANTAGIFDVSAGTTTTLSVGSSPTVLAANPTTNKVYVVNSGDNTVSVIE